MACSKLYSKFFQFVLKFHVNNLHTVGLCVCACFWFFPLRELPLSVWKNNYPSCTSHDHFPTNEVEFFFVFAASFNLS